MIFEFLLGVIICLIWYPLDAWTSAGLPFMDFNETEITPEMNIRFYTMLLFYWICSLPCFAVVVMEFIETFYARKYGKFNSSTVKIFRIISPVLFISSAVFIIGSIIFMTLGWTLSPLYFNSQPTISKGYFYCIIGVIGLVYSAAIYALCKHMERGIAKMQ